MRRRLFTFASAVSALLFVGLCVLWARSYRQIDVLAGKSGDLEWVRDVYSERLTMAVYRGGAGSAFEVDSAGGEVAFYRTRFHLGGPGHIAVTRSGSYPAGTAAEARRFIHESGRHVLGCTFMRWRGREADSEVVVVPYPVAALVAALLPVASAVRLLLLRRRRRRGGCRVCGYDLTGNASGTCPECGTPVAANGAA